jgi:wobble nucleotide-excising tRNase
MANTINHITELKNFGSFEEFTDTSLPEFNKVNLFYGLNGSGKTVLTKLFSCFNSGVLSPELMENIENKKVSINVNINGIDVKTFSATPVKNKIKIFNSDNDFSYLAGKEEIEDLFRFMKDNDEDHFAGLGVKFLSPQ